MQLRVLKGASVGEVFPLTDGENPAGRSPANVIHLPGPHVSSLHCVFLVGPQGVSVRDMGSTNGVVVERKRVKEAALAHGSRVQLGDWLLELDMEAGSNQDADRSITRPGMEPPAVEAAQAHGGGFGPPEHEMPGPSKDPAPDVVPEAADGFGALPAGSSSPFGVSNGGGWGEPEPLPPGAPPAVAAAEAHPPAQTAPPTGAAHPSSHQSAPGASGVSRSGSDSGFGFGSSSPTSDTIGLSSHSEQIARSEERPPPRTGFMGKVTTAWIRVRSLPWWAQLSGLMLLASAVLFLAPGGGMVAQVFRASNVGEEQALERGRAVASLLAARNASAIASHDTFNLDVSFLRDPGVEVAMITDSRGAVRSPNEKVGQTLEGKDFFAAASEDGVATLYRKGGSSWHIMVPIKAAVVEDGPLAMAGWAYVLYDVDQAADVPVGGPVFASFLLLAVTIGGAGVATFLLANTPVARLREELDLLLRGHTAEVEVPREWKDLGQLAMSVNRLALRWRQGAPQGEAGEGALSQLDSLIRGLAVPVLVVSERGEVRQVSDGTCQWLGVAREGLVGRSLGELLPDAGLLAKLERAFAMVAQGEKKSVEEQAQVGANRARLHVIREQVSGVTAIITVG